MEKYVGICVLIWKWIRSQLKYCLQRERKRHWDRGMLHVVFAYGHNWYLIPKWSTHFPRSVSGRLHSSLFRSSYDWESTLALFHCTISLSEGEIFIQKLKNKDVSIFNLPVTSLNRTVSYWVQLSLSSCFCNLFNIALSAKRKYSAFNLALEMLEKEEQFISPLRRSIKQHLPHPRLEGDLSNHCMHSSSKSHPDPLSLWLYLWVSVELLTSVKQMGKCLQKRA